MPLAIHWIFLCQQGALYIKNMTTLLFWLLWTCHTNRHWQSYWNKTGGIQEYLLNEWQAILQYQVVVLD